MLSLLDSNERKQNPIEIDLDTRVVDCNLMYTDETVLSGTGVVGMLGRMTDIEGEDEALRSKI